MQHFPKRNIFISAILLITLAFTSLACLGNNKSKDSKDPQYESQVITIEGLNPQADTDLSLTEISIEELRKLPQYNLEASYKRTTGLTEEFKMSGPYLREVIQHLGGNLGDYAGIGVIGRDDYYCLLAKEVIDATPDLMLALTVDGQAKLDEDNAPARLAVQGQFGPYWVKKIKKIILYKQIPEKAITSVWVFDQLAEGIEPYNYEYYGSQDKAIDLEQVFSRLDHVDSKAFFTMKSADGFKKNEVINVVKSRYYLKVEGQDAPTNVSPYLKLGMNVQNIAWISTNADAAVFPQKLQEYLETRDIDGHKGIPLPEVLYETEMKEVKTKAFEILGTDGEKITVSGEELSQGILVAQADGSASVVWGKAAGYKNIPKLLRIRIAAEPTIGKTENQEQEARDSSASALNSETPAADLEKPAADTVLTITGDGVNKTIYLSSDDLRQLSAGYTEQCFSTVNNFPTRKFSVAKGIKLAYLLEQAGLKSAGQSILVEASDGYKARLTREQLLSKRYSYPGLLSDSAAQAVEVQPMLAWSYAEGTDISKAKDGQLRLFLGQQGLNDVNTAVGVQMVSKITVSTKDNGRWGLPQATLADGQITLQHEALDQVKLYYTLDGAEPTYSSKVYNPSTTYFQPGLLKPIPVSGSGMLKVKVIGYGKRNSEVLTYAY